MLDVLLRRSLPTYAAKTYVPGPLDGLVHLVEGRRGRGKSYLMTYWTFQAWRHRVPVLTNFSVDLYRASILLALRGVFSRASLAYEWLTTIGWRRIVSWDDVFQAMDAWVMLDEAHHYVDARAFKDTPKEFLAWLQQSRKVGVSVVFASQSFEFLDLRVRRLSDILWQARVVPKKDGTPKEFYYYGMDPWSKGYAEDVVRDRADFLMRVPFDVGVAKLYDTLELINPPSGEVSWRSVAEAYAGRRSAAGGRLRLG